MPLTIAIQELPAQPVLAITRRIEHGNIAAFIGETFGKVLGYARTAGATIAGPPFARFIEMAGGGAMTVKSGWPITVPK